MHKKIKNIEKNQNYKSIINYFNGLSLSSDNLRTGYIFGSRAQEKSFHNEFSDLDIEMVVQDKRQWIHNLDWLENFGEIELAYKQLPSDGLGMQVRILFKDMSRADIVFLDQNDFDKAYNSPHMAYGVFGRGVIALFDKDNRIKPRVETFIKPDSYVPTFQELESEYKDFIFHLVYAQNKLKQGEMLVAKDTMDISVRRSIIKFIRWSEYLNDPNKDLWHRSRHFEKWASSKNQELVSSSSPKLNASDISRTISTVYSDVTELAFEIAQELGVSLPYSEKIRDYLVPNKSNKNKNPRPGR